MRFLFALVLGGLTTLAGAQSTMDAPQGETRPLALDSGVHANAAKSATVVFSDIVRVEGAAWLRLFFDYARLEPGSFLRVTSLHDGETQELDAAGLAMWSYSTAFFNGDAVRVEIVAAPGTFANRVRISEVMMEQGVALPIGFCGICSGDDRVPSFEDFAGRLMPNGCSATVFDEESCMLTAGHCTDGNTAMAFRVPASNPDCSINFPPVEEQFPIIEVQSVNGGPGNDWAVLRIGTNNLGQTPFERYGLLIPIPENTVSVGEQVDVWGYGTDIVCVENYIQQTSSGIVNSVSLTSFTHDCDTTFGNSGSGMIRNGELVGIATHCACPNNIATRTDHPDLMAAREEMCPSDTSPDNDDCIAASLAIDGQVPFTTVDATTDGFTESGCGGPLESDVWFRYFALCDGTLDISFTADYSAHLALYSGLGCPDGPDQAIACTAPGSTGGISIPVSVGEVFRLRIGGPAGVFGNGLLNLSCDEPLPCPADCAQPPDGVVDILDLLAMLSQWGGSGSCVISAENNAVDVNDLLVLLAAFGDICE